ncbi:MAG: hypothetical protein Q4D58_01470 [Synergistaceae bacterium]|nr:hypothetical protein [Synergistaceae bacterium]
MDALFILSNSPGELSGWMGPVTREVAKRSPGLPVTAVTLPCPYASGREAQCARAMPGVEEALSLRAAMGRAGGGGKKLILQLGGDPMYGCALSMKLRAPWMIYSARPRWRGRVSHYFIPDEGARRRFEAAGVAAERYSVVGNLILDSLPEDAAAAPSELRGRCGSGGEELISFMPGSRPFEYELGFGFYSECARILRRAYPRWQAIFPVAPTVDEATLRAGLDKTGLAWRGGERVEEVVIDDGYSVPLVREGQYSAIAASSLAVAFPGTNNLQIAALGVPLFMIAPLNQAQNIPLDGLPGAIPSDAPGLGRLKKRLVFWYNAREKFVSLPNRIAGQGLLPERRELMTPESACRYIGELIESPERRSEIVRGYGSLDLRRGAAERIAERLCRYFDA